LWAERYGAPMLIHRILGEYGARHWLSYVAAAALTTARAAHN
jgi:hypothetical protein